MDRDTSTQRAYDIIKQKILRCEYKPGQLISEKEIVEELNISRTPIREALNKLNGEGLLNIIPKKGIQISDLSIKKLKEIFEIRHLLEPLSVKLAIKNIQEKDIEYLKTCSIALSNDFDSRNILNGFKTGVDIHLYIAKLSNNETLYSILRTLRYDSYRSLTFYLSEYLSSCSDEDRKRTINTIVLRHNNILKSIQEKDEKNAIYWILQDLDISIFGINY
jgi:DNA-binding GntR family transcriptional regulator